MVTSLPRSRQRRTYRVTRTWPARGPFGLDSTLNVTLSPPRSESKFSTPSRWKKYSEPSDPAMKPKPRSDTSFLMVPSAIEAISLLLELSCGQVRRAVREELAPKRSAPQRTPEVSVYQGRRHRPPDWTMSVRISAP